MPRSVHDTGWYKSSRSSNASDNCVEVRVISATVVGVRDSKNREAGAIWFASPIWASFIDRTKAGDFDLSA